MKRLGFALGVLAGAVSPAGAQITAEAARPVQEMQAGFDHAAWGALVREHVHATGVDYRAIQSARGPFDRYVTALASIDAVTFDGWTREERIAYLINAYNALVVQQVIDNYPLRRRLSLRSIFRPSSSVWQVAGFFDSIRHRVAGRDMTLDEIEHEWLRARLMEPRIHFALVCAARSCPPLRREAYGAAHLDAQLDDQARQFFNDPELNRFDRTDGRVRLSSILSWFGEDFTAFAPAQGFRGSPAERGSLAFAARFLPAPTAEWLRTGEYEISYIRYDWSLNDRTD